MFTSDNIHLEDTWQSGLFIVDRCILVIRKSIEWFNIPNYFKDRTLTSLQDGVFLIISRTEPSLPYRMGYS